MPVFVVASSFEKQAGNEGAADLRLGVPPVDGGLSEVASVWGVVADIHVDPIDQVGPIINAALEGKSEAEIGL